MPRAQLITHFNHMPTLRLAITHGVDDIPDAIAELVVDAAKPHVPVDTGSARESIHRVTALTNETHEAEERAIKANPDVEITEPVEQPAKGSGIAYIVSCVGHMWILETGSVNQAPRPSIIPAIETLGQSATSRLVYWLKKRVDAVGG